MIIAWTKHIKDTEEKTRFEQSIVNASSVLDRLKDILDEQEKSIDRAETSPSSYDSQNWAYRQAHANGYRQCLAMIKKLIDIKEPHDRELTTG